MINKLKGKDTLIIPIFSLILFALFTSLSYLINSYISNNVDIEGVVSALRLFVTFTVVILFTSKVKLNLYKLKIYLYILAVLNSFLCVVQTLNNIFDLNIIPLYLNYLYFYADEIGIDAWRNGGIMPSLQASSLLAGLGLLLNELNKNLFLRIFFTLIFVIAALFGARTMIVFIVLYLIYSLFCLRVEGLIFLCIIIFGFLIIDTLEEIPGFMSFFGLRIGSLFDVLTTANLNNDYSSADMLRYYNLNFDIMDFTIGNSSARYSDAGGGDPIYTRWLRNSGIFALIFLIIHMLSIVWVAYSRSVVLSLLLLILIINGFKAELFTSFYIYPFIIFVVFPNGSNTSIKIHKYN